jgi:hypothetical protein
VIISILKPEHKLLPLTAPEHILSIYIPSLIIMANKSVYFSAQNDDAEIPAAPAAVVHEANGNVPEARDLTWTDTFYDDSSTDIGVIAVFDVDYRVQKYLIFLLSIFYGFMFFGANNMLADGDNPYVFSSIYIYAFIGVVMAMYAIECQTKGGIHVAVTNEGIRKDLRYFPFGSIFRTTTIVSPVDQTTTRKNLCLHACVFLNSRNVFSVN